VLGADDDPDAAHGPLTSAVLMRIARPQVRADPQQAGEHGIWTTRSDILPGQQVLDGQIVAARWGQLHWFGMARWDDRDRDLIWLTPLPGMPIPRLWATHSAPDLVSDVVDALVETGVVRGGFAAMVVETVLSTRLESLYADVDAAIAAAVTAALDRPAR